MTESSPPFDRLRRRRRMKGLSLEHVARAAGVSIGALSQLERGLSPASPAIIAAVCAALQMPLAWLFDDSFEPSRFIVRADKRRVTDGAPRALRRELLTPDSVRGIQMMIVEVPPGVRSMPDTAAHCFRSALVLSGKLGLSVGGVRSILGKGDSFALSGGEVHHYWCEGNRRVRFVWCVAPAIF